MLVYRVCKNIEFKKILNENNFNNIGNYFTKTNLNTHNYDEKYKYLHFFKDKESIFYLRTLKDRYLCIYDIPEEILSKYIGTGYYWDFINYKDLNDVVEYAIENEAIDISFLKQVAYIKCDIEYEDYLDDNELIDYVDVIYSFMDNKKRILKK